MHCDKKWNSFTGEIESDPLHDSLQTGSLDTWKEDGGEERRGEERSALKSLLQSRSSNHRDSPFAVGNPLPREAVAR